MNNLSDTLLKVIGEDDFLELEIPTPKGSVDLLAEVIVHNDTLHIKDIVIFGRSKKPLTGLVKTFFMLKTQFVEAARKMGFKKLRITGMRTEKSTSASPGKEIDIIVDL